MMKINKAVILAAGYGTRFLPFTKSIQKEMVPIVNRPLIDYVVDDCVQAGIKEIIFVVNGRTKDQIESYYSENKQLFSYLERMGKLEKYSIIENLHTKAKFTYVIQPDEGEYGTAVPLKLVEDYVKDEEAFLLLGGDDFTYNSDGTSETKRMIDKFNAGEYEAVISAMEVPDEVVSKYGIMTTNKVSNDILLTDIVEKPKEGEAKSNLANISKFIFKPSIYQYLEQQKIDELHGELLITDTIVMLAKEKPVLIYIPTGKYYDCGYPEGWLQANMDLMPKAS